MNIYVDVSGIFINFVGIFVNTSLYDHQSLRVIS